MGPRLRGDDTESPRRDHAGALERRARRWKCRSARARKPARFLPSATARRTSACAATSTVSSSFDSLSLPSIIFHRKSVHRLNRFLFEHEAFALVPAPGLVVLADATQPDFIRQVFSSEAEQPPA